MLPAPLSVLVIAADADTTRSQSIIAAFQRLEWQATPGTGQENLYDFAVCIVLLHAQVLYDPLIVRTLSARPARLILLLLEPTQVPYVVWGAPSILAQPDDDINVRQIAQMISQFPQMPPPPSAPMMSPPSMPIPSPYAPPGVSYLPPNASQFPASSKTFPVIPIVAAIAGVLIIVLIASALLITRARGTVTPSVAHATLTPPTTLIPTPTSTPNPAGSYTTNTPGASCDNGNATWTQSSAVTITCGTDGTLMTAPGSATGVEALNFYPPFTSIGTNYEVSLQVTFVNYTSSTAASIEVHRQNPHGGQIFYVEPSGKWGIYRVEPSNTNPADIGDGTVTLSGLTVALMIKVQGGVIQCYLDGQKVITVTDSTYTSSAFIPIGIYDYSHPTTPVSVRVTQFSYIPNPSS